MDKVVTHFTNPGWDATRAGFHVKGSVFSGGALYRGSRIADLIPEASANTTDWEKALLKLNGFFALVKEDATSFLAAVDRVRSLPLFYANYDGVFYISDDAEWVRRQVSDVSFDRIAQEEFQLTGYVTGPDTLFPHVKQLQAGEFLRITHCDTPVLTATRWYSFTHSEPTSPNKNNLYKRLNQITELSIRRLITYANGRQIVIPLSGGYDSRLIALLLKKHGHHNILTFTYGTPGNRESQFSKRVASDLDLPWHFVTYTGPKWSSAWKTQLRIAFQYFSSGWSSLPHLQDWLAVKEMHDQGILDADAVFCPGHSGDFVAGSHIPSLAKPGKSTDLNQLPQTIIDAHYSLAPWQTTTSRSKAIWEKRILDRAGITSIRTGEDLADAFEKWDWQERQAKYIINSVRVYEFFGYDWWLPLWDSEFLEYWQGVPLELRQTQDWYVDYIKSLYRDYIGESGSGNARHQSSFFRIAKAITPNPILRLLFGQWQVIKVKKHLCDPGARFGKKEAKSLAKQGYREVGVDAIKFLDQDKRFEKPNSATNSDRLQKNY